MQDTESTPDEHNTCSTHVFPSVERGLLKMNANLSFVWGQSWGAQMALTEPVQPLTWSLEMGIATFPNLHSTVFFGSFRH